MSGKNTSKSESLQENSTSNVVLAHDVSTSFHRCSECGVQMIDCACDLSAEKCHADFEWCGNRDCNECCQFEECHKDFCTCGAVYDHPQNSESWDDHYDRDDDTDIESLRTHTDSPASFVERMNHMCTQVIEGWGPDYDPLRDSLAMSYQEAVSSHSPDEGFDLSDPTEHAIYRYTAKRFSMEKPFSSKDFRYELVGAVVARAKRTKVRATTMFWKQMAIIKMKAIFACLPTNMTIPSFIRKLKAFHATSKDGDLSMEGFYRSQGLKEEVLQVGEDLVNSQDYKSYLNAIAKIMRKHSPKLSPPSTPPREIGPPIIDARRRPRSVSWEDQSVEKLKTLKLAEKRAQKDAKNDRYCAQFRSGASTCPVGRCDLCDVELMDGSILRKTHEGLQPISAVQRKVSDYCFADRQKRVDLREEFHLFFDDFKFWSSYNRYYSQGLRDKKPNSYSKVLNSLKEQRQERLLLKKKSLEIKKKREEKFKAQGGIDSLKNMFNVLSGENSVKVTHDLSMTPEMVKAIDTLKDQFSAKLNHHVEFQPEVVDGFSAVAESLREVKDVACVILPLIGLLTAGISMYQHGVSNRMIVMFTMSAMGLIYFCPSKLKTQFQDLIDHVKTKWFTPEPVRSEEVFEDAPEYDQFKSQSVKDSMVGDVLKVGLSFLSMYSCSAKLTDKNIDMFLSRVSKVPQAFEGSSTLVTWILDIVGKMVNQIRVQFLGLPMKAWADASEPVITAWCEKVMVIYEEGYRGKLRVCSSNSDRVIKIIKEGEQLLQKRAREREFAQVASVIRENLVLMRKLQEKFFGVNLSSCGPRMEPVVALFSGAPGTGKSWLLIPVILTAIAKRIPREQIPDLLRDWKTHLYAREPEHEYWDNYKQEMAVFIDDFGQHKDVAGVKDTEYSDVIRCGNIFPHIVHSANLLDKGNLDFTSEFLILSSNTTEFENQIASINYAEAVTRRFDFSYIVYPRIEYVDVHDKSFQQHDRSTWRFNKNHPVIAKKEFSPDVYDFAVYSYRTGNGGKGRETGEIHDFHQVAQNMANLHADRTEVADKYTKYCHKVIVDTLAERDLEENPVEERSPQPFDVKADTMRMVDLAATLEIPKDFHFKAQGLADPGSGNRKDCFNRYSEILHGKSAHPDSLDHYENLFEGEDIDVVMEDAIDEEDKNCFCNLTSFDEIEDSHSPMGNVEKFLAESLFNPNTLPQLDQLEGISNSIWFDTLFELNPTPFTNAYKNGGLPAVKRGYLKLWRSVEFSLNSPERILARKKSFACVKVPAERSAKLAQKVSTWFGKVKERVKDLWNRYPMLQTLAAFIAGFTFVKTILSMYEWFTKEEEEEEEYSAENGGESGERSRGSRKKQTRAIRNKDKNKMISQGGADVNCDQVCASACAHNIYRLYYPGNPLKAGYVLGLVGRIALIPRHYILYAKHKIEVGDWKKDDEMILRNRYTKLDLKLPIQSLLDYKDIPAFEENDMVSICLPRYFPDSKSIVDKFVPGKVMEKRKSLFAKLMLPDADGNPFAMLHDVTPIDEPVSITDHADTEYFVRKGYKYWACTSDGDCGGLLAVVDKAIGQGKFIGLHVAGTEKGYGISVAITREDVEDVLKLWPQEMKRTVPYKYDELHSQCLMAKMPEPPAEGTFTVHKVLDEEVYASRDTSIRKSVLYGKWGPAQRAPSRLSRFKDAAGNLIDPRRKGIALYGRQPTHVEPRKVKIVTQALRAWMMNVSTKEKPFSMSIEEAVEGIDGLDHWNAIARNTSPGFPHVLPSEMRKRKGFPGKTFWLGDGDRYDLNNPNFLALKKRVEELEKLAMECKRGEVVFVDSLKDELRKLPKVADGSTRVFSACNFEYLILWRKYFGPFSVWLMRNKIINMCGVGINCYSAEWDFLARMMKSKGKKTLAGDYKGFDTCHVVEILWAICDMINDWFDDGELNARIRRTLFAEMIYSIHISGATIYEWFGKLPSGHPFTTIINCLHNLILLMLCWVDLNPKGLDGLADFFEHVYANVFGDDNIINISEYAATFFNQQTLPDAMLKYGFIYTDETKSGEIRPFRDIEEITYLKRQFRYDAELGRYVAPLDMVSILELPYWYHKDVNEAGKTIDNFEAALGELSLHKREVFDEWAPKMLNAARYELRYTPLVTEYTLLQERQCALQTWW